MAKATGSKAGTGKTGTSPRKTGAATAKETGASAPVSPSAAKESTEAKDLTQPSGLPASQPPADVSEPGATGAAAGAAPGTASDDQKGPTDGEETVQVPGLPASKEQSSLDGDGGTGGVPGDAGDDPADVEGNDGSGAGVTADLPTESPQILRFAGMGRFPLDWAQTRAVEAAAEPVKSLVWGLPEVTEFPAELTLVNLTPARIRVLSLNTRVLPLATLSVQCETAAQYEALGRELSNRARSCRWGSDEGVQVKHGEN